MPFGVVGRVGQRNHVLDWVQAPPPGPRGKFWGNRRHSLTFIKIFISQILTLYYFIVVFNTLTPVRAIWRVTGVCVRLFLSVVVSL